MQATKMSLPLPLSPPTRHQYLLVFLTVGSGVEDAKPTFLSRGTHIFFEKFENWRGFPLPNDGYDQSGIFVVIFLSKEGCSRM